MLASMWQYYPLGSYWSIFVPGPAPVLVLMVYYPSPNAL